MALRIVAYPLVVRHPGLREAQHAWCYIQRHPARDKGLVDADRCVRRAGKSGNLLAGEGQQTRN